MRRIWRWLLNGLTVLSLLLAVGVAVLWVRSYWRSDLAYRQTDWYAAEVFSGRGEVGFGRGDPYNTAFEAQDWWYEYRPINPDDEPLELEPREVKWWMPGVRYVVIATGGVEWRSLHVRYWLLTAFFGAAPAWLWRAAKRKLQGRGLCPTCGYDLRASPDRCPECGTPVTRPRPA